MQILNNTSPQATYILTQSSTVSGFNEL